MTNNNIIYILYDRGLDICITYLPIKSLVGIIVKRVREKFGLSSRYIILTAIGLVGAIHTVNSNIAPVVRWVTIRLVPMVLAAW